MAYKFKIVSGEGTETKIKKTGISAEFTIQDILSELGKIEKFNKEKRAQVEVETAKIGNVMNFHPKVGELTPEELNGAWIVKEATAMITAIENKVKELDELKAELETDLETIKEQTGLKW